MVAELIIYQSVTLSFGRTITTSGRRIPINRSEKYNLRSGNTNSRSDKHNIWSKKYNLVGKIQLTVGKYQDTHSVGKPQHYVFLTVIFSELFGGFKSIFYLCIATNIYEPSLMTWKDNLPARIIQGKDTGGSLFQPLSAEVEVCSRTIRAAAFVLLRFGT